MEDRETGRLGHHARHQPSTAGPGSHECRLHPAPEEQFLPDGRQDCDQCPRQPDGPVTHHRQEFLSEALRLGRHMRPTHGQQHGGPQQEEPATHEHRPDDTCHRPPDRRPTGGHRPPQTERVAKINPLPGHEQDQWQDHRCGLLHRNRQRKVGGCDALRVPQAGQADGQRREALRDGRSATAGGPRPKIAGDVGPSKENLFVGKQVRRDLQHEPDEHGRRDQRHGQRQGQSFDEACRRDPLREPGGP